MANTNGGDRLIGSNFITLHSLNASTMFFYGDVDNFLVYGNARSEENATFKLHFRNDNYSLEFRESQIDMDQLIADIGTFQDENGTTVDLYLPENRPVFDHITENQELYFTIAAKQYLIQVNGGTFILSDWQRFRYHVYSPGRIVIGRYLKHV